MIRSSPDTRVGSPASRGGDARRAATAVLVATLVLAGGAAWAGPHDTAVLLTKRGATAQEVANDALRAVELALKSAEVQFAFPPTETEARIAALGVESGTSCEGKRKCVLELARQLRLPSVVAVTVATLGGELAIHVELLDVSEGKVLAEETVVVLLTARGELSRAFERFGKQVSEVLGARAAKLPSAEATPSARPVEAAGSVVVDAGEGRRSTAKLMVGVGLGAVVVGAVALGFGASLNGGLTPRDGSLPADQVETYKSAQALTTVGAVASGLGAVVAGVGAALWFTAPSPAVQVSVTPVGGGTVVSILGSF